MQLLERPDLQLLAEIGFLAAWDGDVAAAEVIFEGVALARPEAAAPFLGRAIAFLQAGQALDALSTLDHGLKVVAEQDRPELHAFRGVALRLAGRADESLKALRQAGQLPMALALIGESVPG